MKETSALQESDRKDILTQSSFFSIPKCTQAVQVLTLEVYELLPLSHVMDPTLEQHWPCSCSTHDGLD